ncbi:MAG: hypothetical protein IJW17_07395 [Lentisphaeria bacterium]|nr:hypothetical protein [Lentisphaeria bacterium]
MWDFIIRRTFYSVLILLGVVLLTFLLFNVSAGDPAGAVLGKNARPAEVEALRRKLGADLPLFWGRRCTTEAFGRDGRRQFQTDNETVVCTYKSTGKYTEISIPPETDAVSLPEDAENVRFYRLQEKPWNSQFLRAVRELISFEKEFP